MLGCVRFNEAAELDAVLHWMDANTGGKPYGVDIVMPAAVPNIFAGFRIAVPYAIGSAVIAELISSNRGLGYLVQTGAMNFDTTQVFVAILAATIIVHAFIAVIDVGERFLLRWRPRGAALIIDHGT